MRKKKHHGICNKQMTIRLKTNSNQNRNNGGQKLVKIASKCLKKIAINLDLKPRLKRQKKNKYIFKQIKTEDS